MSDREIKKATNGQIIGGWVGVIVMFLLIMYSEMGVLAILCTTILVGGITGATIDASKNKK